MEDSINYIARDNPDAKVHADIQLKRDTDSVQIVIVDDGRTYNPIPGLAEATLDKPGALTTAGPITRYPASPRRPWTSRVRWRR